jgi:hypothetical protein
LLVKSIVLLMIFIVGDTNVLLVLFRCRAKILSRIIGNFFRGEKKSIINKTLDQINGLSLHNRVIVVIS